MRVASRNIVVSILNNMLICSASELRMEKERKRKKKPKMGRGKIESQQKKKHFLLSSLIHRMHWNGWMIVRSID